MNDGKLKIDYEPTNDYDKAKKDLLQALDSFNKLNPQLQQMLVEEIFRLQAHDQMFRMLYNYLGRGV